MSNISLFIIIWRCPVNVKHHLWSSIIFGIKTLLSYQIKNQPCDKSWHVFYFNESGKRKQNSFNFNSFNSFNINRRNALDRSSGQLQGQTTMRPSLPLRLASSSSISSGSALRQTPMALLPPIPLYRRILRAHRKKLPTDLRFLGDSYVKSEFRAHRNVENPIHIVRWCPCPPDYSDQLQGDWNNSLTTYYRSGF